MTAPKLPEGYQALRDATAAVLAPIGNMTDRHTAVLRTMERRQAFQQACGPHAIDALLRALSDAQAALQAQAAEKDAEIAALREDAARYRWLRELPVECPTDGLDIAVWNDCHGDGIRGAELDAAIDSALLAAKEAKQ